MSGLKKVICVFLAFLTILNFGGIGFNQVRFDFTSSYAESIDYDDIRFEDEKLDQVIREYLNKGENDKVKLEELKEIKELNADNAGINDLKSIELLSELNYLYLNENSIDDLSSLKSLNKLVCLQMSNNNISDITGLEELASLEFLDLSGNEIADVTPLAKLISLKHLNLGNNEIQDISMLGNLVNLETLVLNDNKIENTSVISNYKNLQTLIINNNLIYNWLPVISLSDDSLITLYVGGNNKNGFPPLKKEYFPNLKDTDIEVEETPTPTPIQTSTPIPTSTPIQTPTITQTPDVTSIPTITPTSTYGATPTPTSAVVFSPTPATAGSSTPVVTITPSVVPTVPTPTPTKDGVSPKPTPTKAGVTATPPWATSTSTATATATIVPTVPPGTVHPTPTELIITAQPSHTPVPIRKAVFFPDENLAKYIREDLLKKDPGTVIYLDEIKEKGVKSISIPEGREIVSLQGLQYFYTLTMLKLTNQKIEDVTTLGKLTNLENLYLSGNRIKSIYPLRNLPELTILDLNRNQINDANPLSILYSFEKLEELYLSYNEITEAQGLSVMTSLRILYLDHNEISDFKFVNNMKKLECLFLSGNKSNDYDVIDDDIINGLGPDGADFIKLSTPSPSQINTVSQTPTNASPKPTERTVIANPVIIADSRTRNDGTTSTPSVLSPVVTPLPANPVVTPKPTSIPETKAGIVFKDIVGHWAENSLMKLFEKGILSGYPDKSMRPQLEITRAEATVILVKSLALEPLNSKKYEFKDDSKLPSWAYGYIQRAVEKGIIKGYDDNSFRPMQKVSRSEIVSMIVRAFNFDHKQSKGMVFIDSSTIPKWSKDSIISALELGIIKGYEDNTFMPYKHVTRAEAATILENSLNIIEKKKAP